MSERVSVLLIVGCHVDDLDRPCPFVAGCIDAGTMDVIGIDEEESWIKEIRQKYDPEGTEFVWREATASFESGALADLFKRVTLDATVDAPRDPA